MIVNLFECIKQKLLSKHLFCVLTAVVLAVMAPRLSASTRSDMIWQRVCWKLLENVPQRWIESVFTGLVQAVNGYDR